MERGRAFGDDEQGPVGEELSKGVPCSAGGLARQAGGERGVDGEGVASGQREAERLVRQQRDEGGGALGKAARIRLHGQGVERGVLLLRNGRGHLGGHHRHGILI